MTKDEVYAMALAIAKTNGHPSPEEWAQAVADAYIPPVVEG